MDGRDIRKCSFQLANHPGVQQKLRKEVLETLEANGGEIPFEALLKMEYLDAVVNGEI